MTTTNQRTTLYLRGVPTRVVREAKAAAARQGSTLTAFVSETLERSLQTVEATSSATDDDLRAEMRWYDRNRDLLLKRYPGEYVAIVGRSVIDHDQAFDTLATRVFARVGVRNVFMPRVTRIAPVAHLRSPRVRRR
jgi:Family of unknown function (DUF5678)